MAMKKILLLIVFAGVTVGGFTWYRSRASVPTSVLRTEVVSRGDLIVSISATGTVEPEEVIDVGAQVAGRIVTFGQDANGKTVDYCSPIEAGTVLANIDDALYTSEKTQAEAQVLSAQGGLRRAEADLEQANTKLVQAEKNWQRAQQLGPSAALAATEYDNYKAVYDTAKANVSIAEAAIVQAKGTLAQAEGTLDRAKRNLGYTTITSPVKGVIIDRRVNIGQTVVASLNAPSLFLIAKDLTRMQVWVAVNEADIGRLHPGQPVTFTVDAFPGEMFKGRVGKIRLNASMTQNVVTYTVEVEADNSNGRLLPYLTANVKFELNRCHNALMVPLAALRWAPSTEQILPDARQGYERFVAAMSQPANADDSPPATEVMPQQAVVWVPEGQFVRPVTVRLGLANDLMVVVEGEGLTAGTKVVTGEEEYQADSTAAGGSNPFLPKPPRAGKGGPPPPM